MYHLIYKSKATGEFSPSDLKTLLIRARMRNGEVGVTGILVYSGGWFLQALEGEQAAVEAIFSRIEKDPRHGDITVVDRTATLGRRRMFGDWSMAFADAVGVATVLKGFVDLKSGVTLSDIDQTQALQALKMCRQEPSALAV